ncbi:MAG: hypothetical protein CBD60_00130 [Flavobacteriaceae bacterium TMED200]|nr:MAG: hypothetical protein CBD60_00130 [Flavobacteriaceae bacterium TMED200]
MQLFFVKFIPPILLPLFKFIKNKILIYLFQKKPTYDQKIYYNYNEINEAINADSVWESENWINHVKNSLNLKSQLKLNKYEKTVRKSLQMLSLLNFDHTNVIDYGGGTGVLIHNLSKFAEDNSFNLEISIIDNKANIVIAQKEYADKKNIQFYDFKKISSLKFLATNKSDNVGIILNISSVLQYIPKYKSFLKSILEEINPNIICITRFIRCENTEHDAYTIQNISTPHGFCGSTIVNLFGKNSLVDTMKDLNYQILFEDYNFKGDASHYFMNCDNKKYREMTDVSYAFIKKKFN